MLRSTKYVDPGTCLSWQNHGDGTGTGNRWPMRKTAVNLTLKAISLFSVK